MGCSEEPIGSCRIPGHGFDVGSLVSESDRILQRGTDRFLTDPLAGSYSILLVEPT